MDDAQDRMEHQGTESMELLSRTWQTFIFGESEAPVPRESRRSAATGKLRAGVPRLANLSLVLASFSLPPRNHLSRITAIDSRPATAQHVSRLDIWNGFQRSSGSEKGPHLDARPRSWILVGFKNPSNS